MHLDASKPDLIAGTLRAVLFYAVFGLAPAGAQDYPTHSIVLDLNELIAWVKTHQDKVSVGTGGAGTPAHISGVYFQKTIGAQSQLVHYRGAAPAMQDLVGGHIDLMFRRQAQCCDRGGLGRPCRAPTSGGVGPGNSAA